MSKALQERGFESLPSSTKTNTRDQVKSISTAIEVDSHPIRRIRSTQYAVPTRHETRQTTIPFPSCLNGYYCDGKKGSYGPQFLKAYFEASQSITQKEKDPRRLGELAHTKLIVELADRTMKYPKGIAENVLLRRNQGDNLMPTIEEGEVIEEFRTRDDELNIGIDDYSSYCDYDKKIHIDYAHNLKFTHTNFFPLLYINVMSKKFYNSIMKDKMVYKGNNVVGALINVL
ncbi:hypothetical protein Tco_0982694 [Tanacetum coccineum]